METKYLNNLLFESRNIYTHFKQENVLKSATLKEMFSPKYTYRGDKKNTVFVKSRVTNEPVEISWKEIKIALTGDESSYNYYFYDNNNSEIGYKYFYIKNLQLSDCIETEMLSGYMSSAANDLYSGIGIREDERQIEVALHRGIGIIPRSSRGPATLYHLKMGYLPKTDDLLEVESEYDVSRYMRGLMRGSPDIKQENFIPIVIKDGYKYYIDVSKTQAVANVREIKDRLAQGETKKDIENLQMDGIPMVLSGKEFEYWKRLVLSHLQSK